MKALSILVWILICFNNSFGQSGWFIQLSGSCPSLWSVHFTDSNTGWTVGDGGTILKTTNGGTNWFAQSSGTTQVLGSNYFTDSNTGWTVGAAGTILKTTDGGANWFTQSSGTFQPLVSVKFTDSNTGWAAGGEGTILKTTSGGTEWFPQSSGTNINFYEADFIDNNTGWAVGFGATILKTTDGGEIWSPQQVLPTNAWLWSASFTDVNHGCAVGANSIFTTSNGGQNWTELNYSFNFLRSVYFINSDTGWAVGGNDYIVKTTNGGINWIDQQGAGNYLQSVYFMDNKTGWVVGTDGSNGGTIAKTTTGGILTGIQFSTEIPDQFLISQNYPNPFNPSTKISFDISNEGNVNLVIFDVLGRKVSTLVNEKLRAGKYEITWNASGYPAGIYYYQIISGDFKLTKKMILAK